MNFKVGDEVKRNKEDWMYNLQDCLIGQNGEITETTGVIIGLSDRKFFDCVVRWKNGFSFYYSFKSLKKISRQMELFDIET